MNLRPEIAFTSAKSFTSHCTHLPMASGKMFKLLGISAEILGVLGELGSRWFQLLQASCMCVAVKPVKGHWRRQIHHWLREGKLSEDSLYSKVMDPFPDSRAKYIWITYFFKSRGKFWHTGVTVELPQKHSFELFLFCFIQLLSTKSKCFSLCLQ